MLKQIKVIKLFLNTVLHHALTDSNAGMSRLERGKKNDTIVKVCYYYGGGVSVFLVFEMDFRALDMSNYGNSLPVKS